MLFGVCFKVPNAGHFLADRLKFQGLNHMLEVKLHHVTLGMNHNLPKNLSPNNITTTIASSHTSPELGSVAFFRLRMSSRLAEYRSL